MQARLLCHMQCGTPEVNRKRWGKWEVRTGAGHPGRVKKESP